MRGRPGERLAGARGFARLGDVDPSSPPWPRPRDGWTTLLERANHRIERRGHGLWVTVWRRPDLDMAAGAALAMAMVDAVLERVARVRTVVLDLRQAPPVSGPTTQRCLGRLLAGCEEVDVLPVVLHNEGMAALQLGRLVREHAPRLGTLSVDEAAAEALTLANRQAAGPAS